MHIYRFDQILHILTLPLSYLNSDMTSCHSSICVVRSSLIMLSTIFIETGVNFFLTEHSKNGCDKQYANHRNTTRYQNGIIISI